MEKPKDAFKCPAVLQEDGMATRSEYRISHDVMPRSNYANSFERAFGKETYCGNDLGTPWGDL